MAFEYARKIQRKKLAWLGWKLQLQDCNAAAARSLTILLEKFPSSTIRTAISQPMFDFLRYFLIFIMADCDKGAPLFGHSVCSAANKTKPKKTEGNGKCKSLDRGLTAFTHYNLSET